MAHSWQSAPVITCRTIDKLILVVGRRNQIPNSGVHPMLARQNARRSTVGFVDRLFDTPRRATAVVEYPLESVQPTPSVILELRSLVGTALSP